MEKHVILSGEEGVSALDSSEQHVVKLRDGNFRFDCLQIISSVWNNISRIETEIVQARKVKCVECHSKGFKKTKGILILIEEWPDQSEDYSGMWLVDVAEADESKSWKTSHFTDNNFLVHKQRWCMWSWREWSIQDKFEKTLLLSKGRGTSTLTWMIAVWNHHLPMSKAKKEQMLRGIGWWFQLEYSFIQQKFSEHSLWDRDPPI